MKLNKKGIFFEPFLIVFLIILVLTAIIVSLDNLDTSYNDHLSIISKMSTQADVGVWYWEKAAEREVLDILYNRALYSDKECFDLNNNKINITCLDENSKRDLEEDYGITSFSEDIEELINNEMYKYHFNYVFENNDCSKPKYNPYYPDRGEEDVDDYIKKPGFKLEYLDSIRFKSKSGYPDDIFCKQYNIYFDDKDIIGYSRLQLHIKGWSYESNIIGELYLKEISKISYYPHFHLYVDDILEKLKIKIKESGKKIP